MRRIQERFITLDVDDDLGLDILGSLSNAVGTGLMVRRCPDDLSAVRFDSGFDLIIVGGHINFIKRARKLGAF